MKKDFEVMLVEDSRTQALKFQIMLESHGYHVTVAQNGLEAMNMLLNSQTSIVISDWIMPEMDGSELCRAIRKHDFGNYLYIQTSGRMILIIRQKNIKYRHLSHLAMIYWTIATGSM